MLFYLYVYFMDGDMGRVSSDDMIHTTNKTCIYFG